MPVEEGSGEDFRWESFCGGSCVDLFVFGSGKMTRENFWIDFLIVLRNSWIMARKFQV